MECTEAVLGWSQENQDLSSLKIVFRRRGVLSTSTISMEYIYNNMDLRTVGGNFMAEIFICDNSLATNSIMIMPMSVVMN